MATITIMGTSAVTAEMYDHYAVTARVDGEEVTRTVRFADQHHVIVECDGGRKVTMSWSDLRAAADQADEVSVVYRSILDLAKQRRDHFANMAEQAKLLSDALSGRIAIYVSAEQDSTNVWWVSTVRAGNDGYSRARPLLLRGNPSGVTIYGAGDGGTLPTWRLALSEAADVARRIRACYPNARVIVVQS